MQITGKRYLPAVPELLRWRLWITQNFTWLYSATRNAWLIFVLWLGFSRHGKIILGKDTEKPQYDDFSWFAMVVSCGLGMGFWSYGVSNSMAYYRSQDAASTSLINTPFQNDDGRAQQAIFMTLYHYGLQAWGVYVLVTCVCVWRIRRVYFENWGGPFEISNIWNLEK